MVRRELSSNLSGKWPQIRACTIFATSTDHKCDPIISKKWATQSGCECGRQLRGQWVRQEFKYRICCSFSCYFCSTPTLLVHLVNSYSISLDLVVLVLFLLRSLFSSLLILFQILKGRPTTVLFLNLWASLLAVHFRCSNLLWWIFGLPSNYEKDDQKTIHLTELTDSKVFPLSSNTLYSI